MKRQTAYYCHSRDYYTAFKMNQLELHVSIWINIKTIRKGKGTLQNDAYYMVHFYEVIQ